MNEFDLRCVVCGEYCGEGSLICPDCREDPDKLAAYICLPLIPVRPDPRAGDWDYDSYRTDQITKHIRYNHSKRRR